MQTEKRKILIMEKDRENLNILFSILENQYEIITAEDEKAGLNLLEEYCEELSLILLSVSMPVSNEIEFLKKVQGDRLFSNIPIITITAGSETDIKLTCLDLLDLGVADHVRNTYDAELIRKRIQNVIRLKESSTTLKAVERDGLTGLYTEQAFFHYARQLMRFNSGKEMKLIVAKIKDFELLNSIHGMKKMDELVCYLASAYDERVKSGLLAKRGRDSFVSLVCDKNTLDHQELVDTVNKILERAPITGAKVKYGIYENIDKNLSIATMSDYASMAAETVMDNYDCDYAYYTKEMAQKRIYDQMIENSFADALDHQEFVVYYQPQIDIVTEKVIGAEALVRWKKSDGSMVYPGKFIPVYEKDGLIRKLDEYVFRKVCLMQKRMIEQSKKWVAISVNLSRSSALYENVAEQYIKIAKENKVPAASISLEITESAAVYSKRIKKKTEQLVKAGFALHVDDFGSGYSSLASLTELSFSTLKIDKSLIDHICEDRGKTLVEQVIMLSKVLNMKVIAEGVETKEQLEELRKMKCDEVQGFYYAQPMPENEFVEYVEKNRQRQK